MIWQTNVFPKAKADLLTGTQAGYIRFYFFVSLYGKALLEIFISTDRGIVMLLSPFRVCRCPDEALQYKLLQFTGMAGVLFDFFQTGSKIYLIQKLCNIHRSL